MINQAPPKEVMDVLVPTQATSRNFFQNFQYQHHIITHQQRIQVEIASQKGQHLQITNHFATVKDNSVYKITEIQLQNRIIKIFDTFTTVNTSQNIPNLDYESVKQGNKNYTRRQILSKKYHGNLQNQNQNNDNKLRDTKNLVKNTIRLFQTWLQQRMQSGGQVYKSLGEMTKNGRFNNNLIINISKNTLLRRAFLGFCQSNAEDFINKSKIHDKGSHYEAIKKYENLCIEEEDLEQQRAEIMAKVEQKDQMNEYKMEQIIQQQ